MSLHVKMKLCPTQVQSSRGIRPLVELDKRPRGVTRCGPIVILRALVRDEAVRWARSRVCPNYPNILCRGVGRQVELASEVVQHKEGRPLIGGLTVG
jgi:hypothetical protein